ncbi:hypothetical protein LSCM1_07597 [Leishmania martiniquensis]|uniref:ACB domain-containing protein n=1 Tax=Leishmania martiniquensis TaxID=1580590 RepID=A0A836KSQ1_9TRYP|nr:hypothetical protein LSCM1_07597 [Leishmania martiniquensis]
MSTGVMVCGGAADGAAVHAEFTVLRKPSEDNKYWYTAVHEGKPMTFRILDDSGIDPVDGAGYMKARVQAMQRHVQDACVNVAAEHAYRAVLVELSLLDDPMAIPEETQRDMNCAVDLWCPLHVALMTANKSAAQALLQFHVEHAVAAMTYIANTPSTVCDAGAEEAPDFPPAAPALSADAPDAVVSGRAMSDLLVAPMPILECHVRRELGGAVVLLGHFDGRVRPSSSAAVGKSRPPTPAREASSATAAPVNSRHRGIADDGHGSTGAAVAEDALAQSLCTHNDALLQEEDALFKDRGEEYCLRNILTAMRPLLQSVVLEIKRRALCTTVMTLRSPVVPESAIDFVHDYCSSLSMLPQHPPLLIDGEAAFEACDHGDVALLAKVMDAFEGCFAPVLRGQTLLTGRSGGARGASGAQLSAVGGAAPAGSTPPHLFSVSPSPSLGGTAPPSSSSFLSLGGDVSAHGMAGHPHRGGVCRHSHALPPAPFWWCCPPQNVHQLAFVAVWIGCREAVEESSGSGRRRRAVSISNESRVMMATIRQLQESRVAAQRLDSTIWSGHLITITKLLSHECSLEDYMDFVEEGGYFTFTSPRGFCGLFLSALVSGVMAAALVQEPAALRGLRCKVETLLADVPGRPSSLRAYVMGRPSTHAERFRELWIDAACRGVANSGGGSGPNDYDGTETGSSDPVGGRHKRGHRPVKFRSRVELLYYAVVEQVAAAAEEAWAVRGAEEAHTAEAVERGAAPTSSSWPSGATKADAVAALQGWLLMWVSFFTGLRDRTSHRGNLSYSSTSSPMLPQERSQHALNSVAESPLTIGGTSSPLVGTTTSHDQGTVSCEDLVSDDANETVDMVQCVYHALIGRLETGRDPLPTLLRLLFPNGANDMETGASAYGTSAPVDKALPVSSIDQEFASAQRAFAAMAGKESNEAKLKLYSLFKQATIGDVNTDRPGAFDFAGRAKWDAWAKLKGISSLDAKRMYVSEYKMMVELRKSGK